MDSTYLSCGHDLNTGWHLKEEKQNLSFFYINSSVAATVNWIEEFQIRRLPVSL